jgi:hypothetical protein
MSQGYDMHLDEILSPLVVVVFILIAVVLARKYGATPHKILIRLVAANIVLDGIAIAIWAAFPATQWSIYHLGFTIVGAEAAVAASFFALTLYGLTKNQKWAPVLAIAITVTQRLFAAYVFSINIASALTLSWSLVIVYFVYKDLKHQTRRK